MMPHSLETQMAVQKVVVVNGNPQVLGMLESVLDAGHYDMVFVESGDRAYSRVKQVLPDLVILCTRVDALDGLQLLTMLKLDPETRDLPVLTCTSESAGQEFEAVPSQPAEDDTALVPAHQAPRMH